LVYLVREAGLRTRQMKGAGECSPDELCNVRGAELAECPVSEVKNPKRLGRRA